MKLCVGDRVRCIGVQSGNRKIIGLTGTVIRDNTSDSFGVVSVEFDEPFSGGHTGIDSAGKPGHCWNFTNNIDLSKKLELIDESELGALSLDELF